MPGRVLIIDDLATNRIILKVQLAAACYDVVQASSIADACRQLDTLRPDLILMGHRGGDTGDAGATLSASLAELRGLMQKGHTAPVVVLLDSAAAADRIAALRTGVADVLSRPVDERLLRARLRSLMRQRLADLDLHHHSLTARSAGFAEQQGGYDLPGQIAVIAQNRIEARKLQSRLTAHARHGLTLMSTEEIMSPVLRAATQHATCPRPPDAFLIQLDAAQPEEGPRLLSELQADPDTRNCPVIAHLPSGARALAAQLYDLGAGDVVFADTAPQEITLRIERQLSEKRRLDCMRDQLQDGLQAAVTDPLTGLYNRRYALHYLDDLMARAATDPECFAVMVADLDHFKQVNDRLGHAAGDTVLKHVALVLRSCLRADDLVARIGGEEFLIVVPGTSREEARRIATSLCNCISGTPIMLPGQPEPARVTISIGLTLATPGSGPARDIIDEADRALYRSKAAGRNTVRVATRDAA